MELNIDTSNQLSLPFRLLHSGSAGRTSPPASPFLPLEDKWFCTSRHRRTTTRDGRPLSPSCRTSLQCLRKQRGNVMLHCRSVFIYLGFLYFLDFCRVLSSFWHSVFFANVILSFCFYAFVIFYFFIFRFHL